MHKNRSVVTNRTPTLVPWDDVRKFVAKPWPLWMVAFDLWWLDSTGGIPPHRECACRWGWSKTRAYEYIKRWRTMS